MRNRGRVGGGRLFGRGQALQLLPVVSNGELDSLHSDNFGSREPGVHRLQLGAVLRPARLRRLRLSVCRHLLELGSRDLVRVSAQPLQLGPAARVLEEHLRSRWFRLRAPIKFEPGPEA